MSNSSKRRLVITAVIAGSSQSEVARTYGVSQGWISRLMKLYEAEGEEAFEPRSRAPKNSPTATPPATVGKRATARDGQPGGLVKAWARFDLHARLHVTVRFEDARRRGAKFTPARLAPSSARVTTGRVQPRVMHLYHTPIWGARRLVSVLAGIIR